MKRDVRENKPNTPFERLSHVVQSVSYEAGIQNTGKSSLAGASYFLVDVIVRNAQPSRAARLILYHVTGLWKGPGILKLKNEKKVLVLRVLVSFDHKVGEGTRMTVK